MTDKAKIDLLVIAVVSSEDLGDLSQQLIQNGFYFTRVSSRGGLLSDEISSLLIGIQGSRHTALLAIIERCCHTRVKYVPAMDNPLFQGQPVMIEAELGGAVIFTLEVDRFEQL
jgi:uncharacterized protein YaaQ